MRGHIEGQLGTITIESEVIARYAGSTAVECFGKEIKPVAEKMITLGKKGDLAAYRQAMSFITREDVCKKLFKEIAPGYAERNGGYTRIVRTGVRRGDAAETAMIELV